VVLTNRDNRDYYKTKKNDLSTITEINYTNSTRQNCVEKLEFSEEFPHVYTAGFSWFPASVIGAEDGNFGQESTGKVLEPSFDYWHVWWHLWQ
jgi:hypothetical protein